MKKARVIWSDSALNDLDTIYDFIAENSQPAARRIVEGILSRSGQLESFPESGTMFQTVKSNERAYRYLVEGNYKVIYSYQQERHTIHIEVIFDTRYDPEKLSV
ncbi:MAG: type II toxin-antitoxin system RelE/ParE family toxin [Bacteroidetes bacterium]|nr:type II toxin-antitoxin system RelE/ParE family toxin [Bacteroidota bacterium]